MIRLKNMNKRYVAMTTSHFNTKIRLPRCDKGEEYVTELYKEYAAVGYSKVYHNPHSTAE